MSLIDRGPDIFIGTGLFLLLLAAYVAGGDRLICRRVGTIVTCDVGRERILGLHVAEHVRADDVLALSIRRTDSRSATQLSAGSAKVRMTSNDTLWATTRSSGDIALLGGEAANAVVDDLAALLERRRIEPVSYFDSYAILGTMLGVMGLVFVAFGGFARYMSDNS